MPSRRGFIGALLGSVAWALTGFRPAKASHSRVFKDSVTTPLSEREPFRFLIFKARTMVVSLDARNSSPMRAGDLYAWPVVLPASPYRGSSIAPALNHFCIHLGIVTNRKVRLKRGELDDDGLGVWLILCDELTGERMASIYCVLLGDRYEHVDGFLFLKRNMVPIEDVANRIKDVTTQSATDGLTALGRGIITSGEYRDYLNGIARGAK